MDVTGNMDAGSKRVFELLESAGRHHQPCPSNTEISSRLNLDLAYVQDRIKRLVENGAIHIRKVANRRVVRIVESGFETAQPKKKAPSAPRKWSNKVISSAIVVPDDAHVFRDPCFACGVPADRHDQLGCKRWRQG